MRRRLDIGNGEIELEASFWTLVIYEQQFGGDMIIDLFGVEGYDSPFDFDGDGNITIDYSKFSWTSAAKAMWACAKTANIGLPEYEKWMRSMTDVDMWSLYGEFVPFVRQGLFRAGAGDPEQTVEERQGA